MSDTSITTQITDTSLQPIDYTSRDFVAILNDLSRRMQAKIPGWEPVPSSFEMIMLDQFAYVGDILNFYIDRLSAEAYIQTAVLRESVLNLAYAFGYVPTAQTAAATDVTFTKTEAALPTDVTIPKGAQVYANSGGTQVIFETTAALGLLAGASAGSTPVKEGVTVTEEPLGISSGVERMQFPLLNKNVIKDSVIFYVRDGGIDQTTGLPTMVPWTQVYRMIDADAVDRVFTIYVDEGGTSIIRTGDGVTGRIPTVGSPVYATYRYGKGAFGNVPASTINAMVTGGDVANYIASVTNAAPAIGGADAESLESMRTNIPRSLRALDRAVTLQDYADLAIQVPGIAKAAAGAVFNTNVSVAVLGYNYYAPDTAMTSAVNAFFAPRKMIGTTVTVVGPVYKNFNITGTIVVNQLYLRASVQALVVKAINAYYSFASVDFGFTSRLSKLFNVITSVDGVVDCTISQHYMQGDTAQLNQNITINYNEFPKAGTITVTATGGIVPA